MCKVARVSLQDSKGSAGQAVSRQSAACVTRILLRRSNVRGGPAQRYFDLERRVKLLTPRNTRHCLSRRATACTAGGKSGEEAVLPVTDFQAALRTSTVICLPIAASAAWIFSAF